MGEFLDAVTRRSRARGEIGPRHRRDDEPLVEKIEHQPSRPRRRLPAPSLPALLGVGVLVLIGGGAAHLAGGGSAIEPDAAPIPSATTIAVEQAADAKPSSGASAAASAAPSGTDAKGSPARESGEAVVHVSGAVARPGLVRLPAGSRIDDALRAAGGPDEDADLQAVNLARPVVDGEQIHVPRPGEAPPAAVPAGPAPSGGGDGSSGAGASGGAGLIDINRASVEELQELPGVGPAIAQRIVEHREGNGPFASVDQLEEVSGIGPKTLEKIRDRASV